MNYPYVQSYFEFLSKMIMYWIVVIKWTKIESNVHSKHRRKCLSLHLKVEVCCNLYKEFIQSRVMAAWNVGPIYLLATVEQVIKFCQKQNDLASVTQASNNILMQH